MNRKSGTLTGLALLCTSAVLASGAIAGETTTESAHVSYVAIDLTQPGAAEALYQRIQRAARRVCHEPSIRELGDYEWYQKCYDRAVEAAVAKVDSSPLTALHRSKTHASSG